MCDIGIILGNLGVVEAVSVVPVHSWSMTAKVYPQALSRSGGGRRRKEVVSDEGTRQGKWEHTHTLDQGHSEMTVLVNPT